MKALSERNVANFSCTRTFSLLCPTPSRFLSFSPPLFPYFLFQSCSRVHSVSLSFSRTLLQYSSRIASLFPSVVASLFHTRVLYSIFLCRTTVVSVLLCRPLSFTRFCTELSLSLSLSPSFLLDQTRFRPFLSLSSPVEKPTRLRKMFRTRGRRSDLF